MSQTAVHVVPKTRSRITRLDRTGRRAVIIADAENLGVKLTNRRASAWESWSMPWKNVVRIDTMNFEPDGTSVVFWFSNGAQKFLADSWQNWSLLEESIRRHYPDFDWKNFERAKVNKENLAKRFLCWRKPANAL